MIGTGSEAETARMRVLVDEVGRAVPAGGAGEKAWTELVKLLALGEAPELRICPVCKKSGMKAATRCGYCWTKLEKPNA